ncbi:hypothetical protein [Nocardia sp. NPDC052112]|uniref:hypothetical protein n=1 Tax=Nocardia sp. NPDC052112 TaxID=3155646 RepID=UPI0034366954
MRDIYLSVDDCSISAERFDGMSIRPVTTPLGAPIGIAYIAADPGGIPALHRRVRELRSMGLHFAAKAIENEMAELITADGE